MMLAALSVLLVLVTLFTLWSQPKPVGQRAPVIKEWKFFWIIMAIFVVITVVLIFNPDVSYFWKTGDIVPAS